MHKVDHDVKCQEFYGLIPPRFCGEIKTVVYNEFLTATKTIKEKLLEVMLVSIQSLINNYTKYVTIRIKSSYNSCINDRIY